MVYFRSFTETFPVMAAGNQESVKQRIIDERMTETGEADPMFEFEISVQNHGSGYSLRHTIPSEIVRLLELTADDDVVVHAFRNGYWVEPAGGEDE